METQTRPANLLLRALPQDGFNMLAPRLEPVSLPMHFKMCEPHRPCGWVYFPESGVASLVGRADGNLQEVGVVGREGASCLPLVLGAATLPYRVVMQVPGTGHRVAAEVLGNAMEREPGLRDVLLGFLYSLLIQVAQVSIGNAQFNTERRMAFWFLMIHDRVEGDDIVVSHEYVASMLGVGRTGVTMAMHTLEAKGAIAVGRKRITIQDRTVLEGLTGNVYGVAEAAYARRFGSAALGSKS